MLYRLFKSKPKSQKNKSRGFSAVLVVLAVIVLGILSSVLFVRHVYDSNLKPVSSSASVSYFTVTSGTGVHDIALNLQTAGLIRNTTAFEWYVRTNKVRDKLLAGTYSLQPSMSVQQIVKKLVEGDVAKNLLTIIPGQRLSQVKKTFIKSGYTQTEVDKAFDKSNYQSNPLVAALPADATLEGFLYPDSFQKQTETPATTIVSESLDEMQKHVTPHLLSDFQTQGLDTFQAVTVASIVAQETSNSKDAPVVAQVFLLRLKQGMMLGSDPTAFYGADLAGQTLSVLYDSPYNTRLHTGLPPGPIGTVTALSLEAVAHPANTDYLYFVSGDDGVMHFSHTNVEHEALVEQYCKKECGH